MTLFFKSRNPNTEERWPRFRMELNCEMKDHFSSQSFRQKTAVLLQTFGNPVFLRECLLLLFPLFLYFTLRQHISALALVISLASGGLVTVFRFHSQQASSLKELTIYFCFFSSIFLFIFGNWGLYDIDTLRRYPDTIVYETYSKDSLSNIYFWLSGGRPFLTALVFKIFQRDFAAINNFYITAYLSAAFLCIASICCMLRNSHDRLLSAYLLMLLFLNQHTIGFWVTNAMSETLSIAATLIVIALFSLVICFRQNIFDHPLRAYLVLVALFFTTILLISARDTNMYFIPILILFYWGFLPKCRHKAILIVGMVLIFGVFSWAADMSGRWEFSLFNTLTHRIIPDDDLRRIFQQKYDFPPDEQALPCENIWASYPCPNKETIKKWIRRTGAEAYKHFLVTNPVYAFREWLKAWDEMQEELWSLDFKPVYYADAVIRNKKLNPLVFNFPGNISLPLAIAIGLMGLLFLKKNPLILFCLFHFLSQSFIAFHGDAMEVPRHCQQAAMTLKIAAVLCTIQLFLALKAAHEEL